MGNVCLTTIQVEDQTDNTNNTDNTDNNSNVIKGRVAPVMTDSNNQHYEQKMIEPKVKNMKRQLAL